MNIEKEKPLAPFTSWWVGGPAEYFCRPQTLAQLQEAQSWAQRERLPMTLIGGGSNVLISDSGIRGLVLCLKDFVGHTTRIDQNENGDEIFRIEAWAGTGKSELLKIFLKNKLAPALFLAACPAT